MTVVCFKDISNVQRFVSLGQIVSMFQACYFRGKELNYDNIIFEWHDMVTYPNWDNNSNFKGLLKYPKKSILPIVFIPKGSVLSKSIDILDMSQPDVLYEGCKPILSNPMNQAPHLSFLNRYFYAHRERPVFNLKKNNKDYMLFHFRESKQDRQLERNTPLKEWELTLNILRDKYKDMKFYKIGEPSPIDNKFDGVIDYLPDNIDKLFKLINDCKLFVCSPSGPLQIAYMLEVPTIVFSNPSFEKSIDNWNIEYFGKTAYDWIDKDKYLHFKPDEYNNVTKENILNYAKNIII